MPRSAHSLDMHWSWVAWPSRRTCMAGRGASRSSWSGTAKANHARRVAHSSRRSDRQHGVVHLSNLPEVARCLVSGRASSVQYGSCHLRVHSKRAASGPAPDCAGPFAAPAEMVFAPVSYTHLRAHETRHDL